MDTISVPAWLLHDASITDEMLVVYVKLKGRVPLTKENKVARDQLVKKGLVKKANSEANSEANSASLSSVSEAQFKGSNNEPSTLGRDKRLPSEDQLTNSLLDVARPRTQAHINNYMPLKVPREEEEKKDPAQFNRMRKLRGKIKRFTVNDGRTFESRWLEFVVFCRFIHEESCKATITSYLAEQLKARAQTTGIELSLNIVDWNTVQVKQAAELYRQYPKWQVSDWKEAIDWFLDDDFWSAVVIDVKTLRRNINRYVLWRQRREPQKKKFAAVKVIGRR